MKKSKKWPVFNSPDIHPCLRFTLCILCFHLLYNAVVVGSIIQFFFRVFNKDYLHIVSLFIFGRIEVVVHRWMHPSVEVNVYQKSSWFQSVWNFVFFFFCYLQLRFVFLSTYTCRQVYNCLNSSAKYSDSTLRIKKKSNVYMEDHHYTSNVNSDGISTVLISQNYYRDLCPPTATFHLCFIIELCGLMTRMTYRFVKRKRKEMSNVAKRIKI